MQILNNPQHAPNIPVRQMDFSFAEDTPTFWLDNNPLATLFLTALSASFPPGEMSFVRSVRHYQARLNNPMLLAQVRSFIGQEAHHGKEHNSLNNFMNTRGIPVAALQAKITLRIERADARFSNEFRLAVTCALEHFTAIFAERLMANPHFIHKMHPNTQAIWLWHAIEESEHKSVAFDVFNSQVGSYALRIRAMLLISVLFPFFMTKNASELIIAQRKAISPASIPKALALMFGKQGFFTGMLKPYLAYYHPQFHPGKHNSDELRQATMALLQAYR